VATHGVAHGGAQSRQVVGLGDDRRTDGARHIATFGRLLDLRDFPIARVVPGYRTRVFVRAGLAPPTPTLTP
jgi:hypothetical protein